VIRRECVRAGRAAGILDLAALNGNCNTVVVSTTERSTTSETLGKYTCASKYCSL
jgi:hypothetical protein